MTSTRREFLGSAAVALAVAGGRVRTLCADDNPAGATQVHDDINAAANKAPLSMLFQGSSAEECRQWQQEFRAQLNELLGDHRPPGKWTVAEEGREAFDDHTRYEYLLQAEGVPSVPLYLLVPHGVSASKPAPAVLCVHGHGRFGHYPIVGRRDMEGIVENLEKHNYDYGLKFVRRGYVVAAPCMIPFGRRVQWDRYSGVDPCLVNFLRMQALGQLPMAANLRDLKWTLDFLQKRPEVKADQLGCAGLSYGGRMTMLVAAMDERIKIAAVSGALNLLQERTTKPYGCGSQIIPGILRYGDYSEIGSLIAPRPCVWEIGSDDPVITPRWDRLFRQRLGKAYRALGADDQLHFDDFEGWHRWNGRIAFPLFKQVLER